MVRTVSAAASLFGILLTATACASLSASAPSPSLAALQRAQAAAQAHDVQVTLAALNEAENAWLDRYGSNGNPCMFYEADEMRAIGNARAAVMQKQWRDADYYIRTALTNDGLPG
ncbi:MAG TPA: hypothetical protein VFN46_00900 [Acetobacteraceae bacterium]|nr:hypothetical protein [Acetobacteraceae bacterium]